jgi:hypothetical protein
MSDATPPVDTNVKVNEQKMTSKVFKFSFGYTGSTKHKVAPSVIHTHGCRRCRTRLALKQSLSITKIRTWKL